MTVTRCSNYDHRRVDDNDDVDDENVVVVDDDVGLYSPKTDSGLGSACRQNAPRLAETPS